MGVDINKIYTGSKFYRYNEGEINPEIIRIRNIDYDKRLVKYFDKNGEKKKIKYDDLLKSYKMLSPDGLINFSTVQAGPNPDVVVALQPFPKTDEELHSMDNMPYAICRQMATDVFSNNFNPDDMIIGVSISKDTCPANVDFNCMLACSKLMYTKMVAIYIDDALDTILGLFDNTIFDNVFAELHKILFNTKGSCTSLRELLLTNNFMYDFRKCFKIMEVPYSIDEESDALSDNNIEFLSKELKINILETYVIRYSRTIDLRKIKRDYVLVSSAVDEFSKLYIVGYDKD